MHSIIKLFLSTLLLMPLAAIGMQPDDQDAQLYEEVEQIVKGGSTIKDYYTAQLEQEYKQVFRQSVCEKSENEAACDQRINTFLAFLDGHKSNLRNEKNKIDRFSRFYERVSNALSLKSLSENIVSYVKKACKRQNINPKNIVIYTDSFVSGTATESSIVLNPFITDNDAQKAIVDHELTHAKCADNFMISYLDTVQKDSFHYSQFAEYRADVLPALESIKKARRLEYLFCNCGCEIFPWTAKIKHWTIYKIWPLRNTHKTDKERCAYLKRIRSMLEIEREIQAKMKQEKKCMKSQMKTFDPVHN